MCGNSILNWLKGDNVARYGKLAARCGKLVGYLYRSGDGGARQATDRASDHAYDPSDLEDRYETRLRAMIDAKLKGEGIDVSEPAEPDRTNVVDLMAALKKSLAQEAAAPKKARTVIRIRRSRSVLRLLRPPNRVGSGHNPARRCLGPAIAGGGSFPDLLRGRPGRQTPDHPQGGQARNRPCRIRGIGNASVRGASRTSCRSRAACLGGWFRVRASCRRIRVAGHKEEVAPCRGRVFRTIMPGQT